MSLSHVAHLYLVRLKARVVLVQECCVAHPGLQVWADDHRPDRGAQALAFGNVAACTCSLRLVGKPVLRESCDADRRRHFERAE